MYIYDNDGNLARGIVNGVVTFYPGRHYNRAVDGANVTVKKFYTLGSTTIAVRTVQGSNDTLNWILGDHLGSTTVTANADGTWNSEIKYTAFGEVRASYGLTPTEYRYTGQLEQAELGLYYYVTRWYDPCIIQFNQPDTLVPSPGKAVAWNRYAYADWNPIRYSDPTGHRVCEGTSSCNPLPKSTYTKQYYQRQLLNEFSWSVDNKFTYKQTKYLLDVAWNMRTFLSNETQGYGKTWMDKNVGSITFKIDTVPQNIISILNGEWKDTLLPQSKETSFVPATDTIHFSGDFMKIGEVHVLHEVSHVIDNQMGNTLSTYFGHGPSDELVKLNGGNPNGIRFWNGNFDILEQYKFKDPNSYGNNSYADYFATGMSLWLAGSSEDLPQNVEAWLESIVDLTK